MDWVPVFIRNGGDSSKIVSNGKNKDLPKIIVLRSNDRYCSGAGPKKTFRIPNSQKCGKEYGNITREQFVDIMSAKGVIIDDKKLIDESQKKILEELRNNNKATNDLKDTIGRTRDLKTLACILGGNLNLLNIVEFIEDCY